MSPLARPFFLGALSLTASLSGGCLADVGECDESLARQVVFIDTGSNVDGENGEPMYAGQALVQSTCGNGQFCHAEGAKGASRYGVPRGFDFDFGLACTNGPCRPNADEIKRLHDSQEEVLDKARLVLSVVRSGEMPPGAAGQDVIRRAPSFRAVELAPGAVFTLRDHTLPCADQPPGTCEPGQTEIAIDNPLLPKLGTEAGNEILRNWLACGAPVVESTGDPGASPSGGDCGIPGENGHTGTCVVRIPAPIEPPEMTWTSIYSLVIQPRCGTSCHTPTDSVNFSRSKLDLSNQLIAYASIFNHGAEGQECGGMGSLVVAGEPDSSIFLLKMERTPDCGDSMPTGTSALDPAVVAVIRAWIAAGAPNN